MALIITAVCLPFALFVLYLAYCTLRIARDNGKLAATPLPVRTIAWLILCIGFALDILFNVSIGTLGSASV